jgi:hypothetical protein
MQLLPMRSIASLFILFIPLVVNATAGLDEKHAAALISWLQESGGFFHPNLEMRRVDRTDSNSRFGMFAKGPISHEETMLQIPTEMILDSREEEPVVLAAMMCGTVRNLIEQLKLKDDSKYAPYVNYLLETQPPGQIPSAWSDAGKELLMKVLEGDSAGEDSEYIVLPPSYPLTWVDEWVETCNGSNDPLEIYAALMIIQRSWDDILIPVFDMMSHRNGDWTNTASNGLHKGEPAEVYASRDIEAGEEIYTTYNHCEDCGARYTTYGTPEILREYGFVEQVPQSWNFHELDIGFRMDRMYDENGDELEDEYEITEWIFGEPDNDDIGELSLRYAQVVELGETLLKERDENVPDREWNTIVDYVIAMELAIKIAIATALDELGEEDDEEGDEEEGDDEDDDDDWEEEEDEDDEEEDQGNDEL